MVSFRSQLNKIKGIKKGCPLCQSVINKSRVSRLLLGTLNYFYTVIALKLDTLFL